jgi:hypothetical protein
LRSQEPVSTSINPRVEEAFLLVKDAMTKRKGLLIVGNIWVDYRGRANSKLAPGERIVIFKEDGSVLVHRPIGYEPVNWQPPGCIFQTSISGSLLQIRTVRLKPSESVKITFNKVYLLAILSLQDQGEFALHASEKDMQQAILLQPSLVEAGFKLIEYEKRVEPGFVDVYGVDQKGRFVVVEIKRTPANKKAALQLAKYVDAVKGRVNRPVRGILVAPNIGKGVQRPLATLGLSFKALDPKKCAEILSKPETKRLADFFEKDKRSGCAN